MVPGSGRNRQARSKWTRRDSELGRHWEALCGTNSTQARRNFGKDRNRESFKFLADNT